MKKELAFDSANIILCYRARKNFACEHIQKKGEKDMIFIGFALITGLLLAFAHFAGNMSHFVNLDSVLLVVLPGLIFSVFTFKFKEYVRGIKSMFAFSAKNIKKDNKVASHFQSLMFVTIAFGILSSIQGLFSYVLTNRDHKRGLIELPDFVMETTVEQAIVYACFTTAYALLVSFFLLYPVHIIHKED